MSPRALLGLLLLAAPLTAAAAAPERFHPPFVVYDHDGRRVRDSGRPVDSQRSCIACHDTGYITAHDLHARHGVAVDCLACHAPHGLPQQRSAYDAEGRLGTAQIELQAPADEQCLACHGSGGGPRALALAPRYLDPAPRDGRHPEHLSRESGTVFSPASPAESRLALEGKAGLLQPWDAHAARLVACIDCHSAPNKPSRRDPRPGPGLLKRDPRQVSSGAYLLRPDHRLGKADCLSCHEPSRGHGFLPYAQRHFDQLACQACHVPSLHAPVLRQEDRAGLGADGRPRLDWRNLAGGPDDPLNARAIRPLEPILLSLPGPDGAAKVRPVNIVTERFWVDAGGRELDPALVHRAWAGRPLNAPSDGSEAALAVLRTRLRSLGVKDPWLRVRNRVVPVAHGVQSGPGALRACLDCHREGGRMDRPPNLGDLAPLGGGFSDSRGEALAEQPLRLQAGPGGPQWQRTAGTGRLYLPGLGRQTWSTRLGFSFFVLTVLGVAGHAFWRWYTQRRRRHAGRRLSERVYLYSAYERFWHWTMAASTLGLVLTGLEIHFNAVFTGLGFSLAVRLHNALALLLLANAALSLFFHVSTGGIGQFIPRDEDLGHALRAQLRYYLKGIFEGAAHPVPKTIQRKLNPLQQLTYLALLNVLLPFQVLTGVLIWGAGRWPALSAGLGGLSLVTPLHNLGSWLFLSFTLGHVYLTTTGHTPSSNLKAMLDGWDQVDAGPEPEPEEDYRGAD